MFTEMVTKSGRHASTLLKNIRSGEWIKSPIFWARFMAYALPLSFFLYVLYINYLPFGYHKTYTIDVGSQSDTSGEFRLEPSPDLSERKTGTDANGNTFTYRELNGTADVTFSPSVVLKNATITMEVIGDGVSIIPPHIHFDPNTVKWDYSWDFTNGIPKDLTGNAFMFDGELTFNGKDTRLELPNSADLFEDGPFTVYVEWTPKDDQHDAQQIVGHFNWEIWQNKDSVEFTLGKMNDKDGRFYKIKYPVSADYFNTKHTALIAYNPGSNGFASMYVDGNLAGRVDFKQETIFKEYSASSLTFGWTGHNYGKSPHFNGNIKFVGIDNSAGINSPKKVILNTDLSEMTTVSLSSISTSTIQVLKLYVEQN